MVQQKGGVTPRLRQRRAYLGIWTGWQVPRRLYCGTTQAQTIPHWLEETQGLPGQESQADSEGMSRALSIASARSVFMGCPPGVLVGDLGEGVKRWAYSGQRTAPRSESASLVG